MERNSLIVFSWLPYSACYWHNDMVQVLESQGNEATSADCFKLKTSTSVGFRYEKN